MSAQNLETRKARDTFRKMGSCYQARARGSAHYENVLRISFRPVSENVGGAAIKQCAAHYWVNLGSVLDHRWPERLAHDQRLLGRDRVHRDGPN
jgi:hypothetical protein